MRRDVVVTFLDAMEKPDKYKIHLSARDDDVWGTERDTNLHDYYEEILENYSKIYHELSPRRRAEQKKLGSAAIET